MDVNEALEFADRLVYIKTGKHLTDLERKVFVGSWSGQTYEVIYPDNPEYIEKSVGYKLWQKLTKALEEKVTKKTVQGAIERAFQRQRRVVISHWNYDLDRRLACYFYNEILNAGHEAFVLDVDAIATYSQPFGSWLVQIDRELERCDCILLLLSPQAAVSEMAMAELRQVREFQEQRGDRSKPMIISIQINFPPNLLLNPDLRIDLQGSYQLNWQSPADTTHLLQTLLNLLQANYPFGAKYPTLTDNLFSENAAPAPFAPPVPMPPGSLAPLPVAEPELPKGLVPLDSVFYVERIPYEAQCYEEVLHPGSLIRIKAPRQMGKTSLMSRILRYANEKGYQRVSLNFQYADQQVFMDLGQFLRWFCNLVARKLQLAQTIEDYWMDTFGSKDNCTNYFEDCVLPAIDTGLVMGLDEIDRMFQYPEIADDFLSLLRAWHEDAKSGDNYSLLWRKLRLVVVHSTEVYIPLDVNRSPFNVGLSVELPEFSPEQVQDLARRHGLSWQTTEIEALMAMVGGHPYLVRLALYAIARQHITLNKLLETAPTEEGIYGDHLRYHLWHLRQHPELETALYQVLMTSHSITLDSEQKFKLLSFGLVKIEGNGVTPRCELYRLYFRDRTTSQRQQENPR
ncbi:MAG: TIR domain-containing protein [Cyanobacteria bacterium CRU_2_1]|nr:TIR domain-containing protein [Cyanobacteria bacterium RU_5_0]NJR58717.1 TIR domain-containing protein [Cyanobacteria bacterium CRU_2_1]